MEEIDHDILIEIKVKLERVIMDVASLNNTLVGKVEKLECDKAEKKEMDKLHQNTVDHLGKIDGQISSLNRWRNYIAGSLLIVVPIMNYLITKYL